MKRQNEDLINQYLAEHIGIARRFPVMELGELFADILDTYIYNGEVFTFGNGGGASIAEHFASDLKMHPFISDDKHHAGDIRRLKVHCLNESTATMTRIANDMGYEYIFTEQLKNYPLSSKDLVVAFSTSGNSPNILNAVEYAKGFGVKTCCISGRNGGKVKDMVDTCILVPGNSSFPGQTGANNNTFNIEDFQSSVAHIITGLLKEALNGETLKHSYTASSENQEELS